MRAMRGAVHRLANAKAGRNVARFALPVAGAVTTHPVGAEPRHARAPPARAGLPGVELGSAGGAIAIGACGAIGVAGASRLAGPCGAPIGKATERRLRGACWRAGARRSEERGHAVRLADGRGAHRAASQEGQGTTAVGRVARGGPLASLRSGADHRATRDASTSGVALIVLGARIGVGVAACPLRDRRAGAQFAGQVASGAVVGLAVGTRSSAAHAVDTITGGARAAVGDFAIGPCREVTSGSGGLLRNAGSGVVAIAPRETSSVAGAPSAASGRHIANTVAGDGRRVDAAAAGALLMRMQHVANAAGRGAARGRIGELKAGTDVPRDIARCAVVGPSCACGGAADTVDAVRRAYVALAATADFAIVVRASPTGRYARRARSRAVAVVAGRTVGVGGTSVGARAAAAGSRAGHRGAVLACAGRRTASRSLQMEPIEAHVGAGHRPPGTHRRGATFTGGTRLTIVTNHVVRSVAARAGRIADIVGAKVAVGGARFTDVSGVLAAGAVEAGIFGADVAVAIGARGTVDLVGVARSCDATVLVTGRCRGARRRHVEVVERTFVGGAVDAVAVDGVDPKAKRIGAARGGRPAGGT